MKHFVPFNKSGNVEMSEKELKQMLADAYKEGYIQGQIDHVLNTAPDFSIDKEVRSEKKKEFTQNGKVLVFRATIL